MPFCSSCGAKLEPVDRFCAGCGRSTQGDVSSQSRQELDAPVLEGMDYKGVGIRFVATLIDSAVMLVVFLIVGFITAAITGDTTGGGFNLHGTPAFIVIFIMTAFFFAYNVLLEGSRSGQTLGKKLTGIRVCREDGSPADFKDAFVRTILRVVDGLLFYVVGAILVWKSPSKQRLGDRIARTVVVKKQP